MILKGTLWRVLGAIENETFIDLEDYSKQSDFFYYKTSQGRRPITQANKYLSNLIVYTKRK